MKKRMTLACILLAAIPALANAQGTANDMETDFGSRFSATLDKKISKGFHWFAEGEIRTSDNFTDLGRYQAGTGLTYKISPNFKIGAGYLFINKKNSSDIWKPRHRFYGDASVGFNSGNWRFSVKERLQYTHREVGNPYQSNPNSLTLKSRLKVSYKASSALTPYGYIEFRNVLNDPACSATWNTANQSYSDYSFEGYNDAYLNRVRGSLGVDWKLDKRNSIDFYLLGDYCYDKNIDTNAEGTKLKSLTYDRTFKGWLGIGYKFSF